MSDKPNQLGWVTGLNYNYNQDFADVSDYSGRTQYIPTQQSVTFELSGMAANVDGLFSMFDDWMKGGIYQPTFHKEWRCLYCTSPNSINRTHCSQCGAPRSFVLG